MRAVVALSAVAVLMSGCVADTMRGYVGQDVRNVELAYGPPINAIDLGGGTRAFQWSKTSVDTTPMSVVSTTDKDRKGRRTTRSEVVGGQTTVSTCLYTFRTAWDPVRAGWIVTGFQPPSFDCAIGSLG